MKPASTAAIGTSEVDLLAKQLNDTGDIAVVSAAASATNQNAWIGYMKQELKKYPNMHLVSVVYGNDDPTTASQVTSGLLQKYPHLKGIISPTTVGIVAAAGVLDTPQYRGKVALTGLGTPLSMKKIPRRRRNSQGVRALESGKAGLSRGLRSGQPRFQEDHQRQRSVEHRRASWGRTPSALIRRSCWDHPSCQISRTSTSSTSKQPPFSGHGWAAA